MTPSEAADKAHSDWLTPPEQKDRSIVAVRLLQPIQAMALRVEAGALVGPPADWAAHLIQHGIAKKAQIPEGLWYLSEPDCRFCRKYTDDEFADILDAKIENIPDPEFPDEAIIRESYALHLGAKGPARPATKEEVAAYRRSIVDQSPARRLDNARRGLLKISGTVEHADGERLLKKADGLWRQIRDRSRPPRPGVRLGDQLLEVLDHLSDVIHAGFRRKNVRPILSRDAARQEGARKPRGSRMPQLDAWLDAEIRRRPAATKNELWRAIPILVTNPVYRDGDAVYEVDDQDRAREIGRAGFDKRVTEAKKRRKRR